MTREELNQQKQKDIIVEELREKRKNIALFCLKCFGLIIVGFLVFYLYTTYVSTSKLIVKEERIVNKKLPSSFDGLKIIHFSDLHYGSTVFYGDIKKIVKEINNRKPDIVVFTGDLVNNGYELDTKEQEKIIKILKSIDTKLGKYAVSGEEDGDIFNTIMKQSNFIVLDNTSEFIYNNDNEPILLVGLSSKLSGDINIDDSFAYFADPSHNTKIFTVSLMHEPDSVDEIFQKYSSDLILAGHSHNGNIRIPYLGALRKVEGAKKYDQSYYKVNGAELYISSGIGTNGPGFRLFCRPSINFFRISSK